MAWEMLTEQFNCQAFVKKCEAKQIKKCWENIRSRAKKTYSEGEERGQTDW